MCDCLSMQCTVKPSWLQGRQLETFHESHRLSNQKALLNNFSLVAFESVKYKTLRRLICPEH